MHKFHPIFPPRSPSVTQVSVSQEDAYKKSFNPSPFLNKSIGSNNSFLMFVIEAGVTIFLVVGIMGLAGVRNLVKRGL